MTLHTERRTPKARRLNPFARTALISLAVSVAGFVLMLILGLARPDLATGAAFVSCGAFSVSIMLFLAGYWKRVDGPMIEPADDTANLVD